MIEEWRPVKGFEDRYQVSNLGRIKSLSCTLKTWFGSRVRPERLMKPKVGQNGYLKLALQRDGITHHTSLHVLVIEAFGEQKPSGKHEVRHRNGNRLDCALANLTWGTRLENMRDQYLHGTRVAGGKHPRAKLTEELAAWVRESCQPNSDVAHAVSVEPRLIWRVRRNTSYSTTLGHAATA